MSPIRKTRQARTHSSCRQTKKWAQVTSRVPCPLAQETGCAKTFKTAAIARGHQEIHGGRRFPCPLADETGCVKIFTLKAVATRHGDTHRSLPRIPCPFAKEQGCEKTFTTQTNAWTHRKVHEGRRFPCPLADETGCDRTFSSKGNANLHTNVHRGNRFPCPFAGKEGCHKTFSTRANALAHATQHQQLRFPCPWAKQQGCSKTFATKANAQYHLRSHMGTCFPCPLAKEGNCKKTLKSKRSAQRHADLHHRGGGIPCPYQTQYNCNKRFVSPKGARDHARIHLGSFECPQQGCMERFTTALEAFRHAETCTNPKRRFLLCPLPMCRSAMRGTRFQHRFYRDHMEVHIRRGEVDRNAILVPQEAEALPVRSRCDLLWTMLRDSHVDAGQQDEPSEESSNNLEEASAGLFPNVDQKLFEIVAKGHTSSPDGTGRPVAVADRARVLEWNTSVWDDNKWPGITLSLGNLARPCIGPSASRGFMLREKCPYDATIDLDTARLVPAFGSVSESERLPSKLRLDNRCITCYSRVQLESFFKTHGVPVLEKVTAQCNVLGCRQESFQNFGKCVDHSFGAVIANRNMERDKQMATVASCRATLEVLMQEPWACPAKYDIVSRRTSEIQQHKRSGSDLVVLDTEFSPASLQLWEFSIVEKVSGNCLIDTCIIYENGLNHESFTRVLRTASENKASAVYNSPRRTTPLTVDEIAAKLVAAGITPDTIFIVWHYAKTDLQILRDFLEAEGHTGILPKDKNCISLLKPFQDNLKVAPNGLKAFPLRLELLFPIFFPRHDLIGLNHRALEDTLQTRLLALAFDELCKPTKERSENWRPAHLARVTQTSITDFYQHEKGVPVDPHLDTWEN